MILIFELACTCRLDGFWTRSCNMVNECCIYIFTDEGLFTTVSYQPHRM